MRLKETHDNWRASGIIKRDFKHDHSQPEEKTYHRKKSTRKWCKGVVGKKHDYQKTNKPFIPGYVIDLDKCTRCGKEKYGGIRQVKKNS